jgi:zinc transporter, ZIP family
MSVTAEAVAWGAAVGGSLLLGAVLGSLLPALERTAATVTVFGGGLLLGALAFELVPDAERDAGVGLTAAGLVGGAVLFLALDWLLTRNESRRELRRAIQAGMSGGDVRRGRDEEGARGRSIALGIFIDGVPETTALGLTVAEGKIGLALLVGIVVSNLVEAYGASEPIVASGSSRRFAIGLFAVIGAALFVALLLGATLLSDASDSVIGTAEAVAGGAIFATVLVAVIPHAFAEVSRWAAVAAILGLVTSFLLS